MPSRDSLKGGGARQVKQVRPQGQVQLGVKRQLISLLVNEVQRDSHRSGCLWVEENVKTATPDSDAVTW